MAMGRDAQGGRASSAGWRPARRPRADTPPNRPERWRRAITASPTSATRATMVAGIRSSVGVPLAGSTAAARSVMIGVLPISPSFHGTFVCGNMIRVTHTNTPTHMTIDELARRAGTTSRNVRAYQERGLLPPPERDGRVGVYGEGHLARLRLIANLADKGFSLASIAALLQAWERGHSIRDLLEVEEAVTAIDEAPPVVMTLDELADHFGGADAEATARAIELGLLEPD